MRTQVGSEAQKGGGQCSGPGRRHRHSPCDLRSPDSLRFVCDPKRGEGGRVSNLHIGCPLPQPTASRTLGSPCLSPGPGPFLLAGAELGRAGSQNLNSLSMPRRGVPFEMVSAGRRKDTEEFGSRKRKGLGRDTHLQREGHGHTHTHPSFSLCSNGTSLVRPAPFKTALLFPALVFFSVLIYCLDLRGECRLCLGWDFRHSVHSTPGSKIGPGTQQALSE